MFFLFVVYTFKDIILVKVSKDELFIQEMISKLLEFYESHFKLAILNKFFYKSYDQYSFIYE